MKKKHKIVDYYSSLRSLQHKVLRDAEGFPVSPLVDGSILPGWFRLDDAQLHRGGKGQIISTVRHQQEFGVYYDTTDQAFERAGIALRIKNWYDRDIDQAHPGLHTAFFLKKMADSPNDGIFQNRHEYMISVSESERSLLMQRTSADSGSNLYDFLTPAPRGWSADQARDEKFYQQFLEAIFKKLAVAAGVSNELFNRPLNLVTRVASYRYGLDIVLNEGDKKTKVGFLTLDFFSSLVEKVTPLSPANRVNMQYEIEILPQYYDSVSKKKKQLAAFLSKLEKTLPGTVDFTPKYLRLLQCSRLL